LLSNFVLSNFGNNCRCVYFVYELVVICFQTLFFLILVTTGVWSSLATISCDLLSNFVLSNFGNNAYLFDLGSYYVVICFQTLFFLILVTTALEVSPNSLCCDLLSNFVLSNFGNNITDFIKEEYIVVICFQTLFFLILVTTIYIPS